jgi:ATP-dependent RNA helicase RhlE
VYPVGRELKAALLAELVKRNIIADAFVFTRTKPRANRLADYLDRQGISTARIHGNRSQSQRTAALQGFKAGRSRILVATDIVARGIDIEELGHVINFDVPQDPDAYIHRVGRTARAEMTGDAFTLVSPDEEQDMRAIERAIGKALPRVTLPGFDYAKRTDERLEIPVRERLAAARAARRPRREHQGGPSSQPSSRAGHSPRTGGQRKEERFRSILDRHAPAAPASRGGPSGRPGPHRRRG